MFPTILAYASIATLMIAIVVSIDRGQSIFSALAPIKDVRAFWFQLVIFAAVVLLAFLQLTTGSLLLGQPPMAWSMLLILAYLWRCIWTNRNEKP